MMRSIWVTVLGASICACTGTISGDGVGDDGTGSGSNPGDPGTPGDDAGVTPPGHGAYFQHSMFFDQDVSTLTKSASSDSMLAALSSAGGFGTGRIQVDFAIDVLTATGSTPMQTFTPNSTFYSPDCDHIAVPIPPGGNLEDENGYACTGGGDCHLIVHDPATSMLYEMWKADMSSGFSGGCMAAWNTAQVYTDTLRGDQCTSADAAGFPIAPLLFTADEVAAGHIDHAIRFILPNNRIKRGFTRPATHATDVTGGTNAPPYGVHFRLRADYPVDSLPSEGAKVVARAMQKYGMYHADGGNIALTAQSDRHTTAKWSTVLDPLDLQALQVSDFEVIDHGGMIPLTYDCNR